MLGAVPVPVYADAVAEELAHVPAHADALCGSGGPEQVDKILTVSERLPKLEQDVYDEPRGR
jgi:long-chain acyl-CoA synthetase